MPITGRPDFWYGQVLLFETEPTENRTDAGPASSWAYDHYNTGVHLVNQPSDASAQIAVHNISAAHGRTNLDGVTERDTAIEAHRSSGVHSANQPSDHATAIEAHRSSGVHSANQPSDHNTPIEAHRSAGVHSANQPSDHATPIEAHRLNGVHTLEQPMASPTQFQASGMKSVVTAAQKNANGAWVELIASTNFAITQVMFFFPGAIESLAYSIGIGASGSESILLSGLLAVGFGTEVNFAVVTIPFRVASTNRLAIRIANLDSDEVRTLKVAIVVLG